MTKALTRALLCGIAGFLAWFVTEPFAPRYIPADPSKSVDGSQSWLILLIGALVGVTAGIVQGLSSGSRRHVIECGALGLVFGSIGSTFGAGIGAALVSLVMHASTGDITYMEMPRRMVARVLALVPIGLFMGLGVGATLRSRRGVLSGMVGGAIGGLATGFAFDSVAEFLGNFIATSTSVPPPGMLQEIGGPSRAVLATGLGAFVGLFCALVDMATRQAWVRLVLGRNEGKEWPIDGPQTTIGRDERANVPLFGDMNVAPLHAIIFNQGSRYVLQDQNTPIGVGFNGQRVGEIVLSPGDQFQVAGHTLQFLMKDSAARALHEGRARAVMTSAAVTFDPPGAMGSHGAAGNTRDPSAMGSHGAAGNTRDPSAMGSHGAAGNTRDPSAMGSHGAAGNTRAPASGQEALHIHGTARSLVATNGPLSGQRFGLTSVLEVGRESPGINLGFDPQASRRHATFNCAGGIVSVQDLGSTNGTIVNGSRVSAAQLKPGDTVQIGNTVFRVE